MLVVHRAVNGGIDTTEDVDIMVDTSNLELQWMSGNLCSSESCTLSDMAFFQEENMTLVYRIIEAGSFDFAASILGPNYDPDLDNNTELIIGTAGEATNDIIFADGFNK